MARIDDYGELLRVRLAADSATVWALAPGLDDDTVSVVDPFEICSRPHARRDR